MIWMDGKMKLYSKLSMVGATLLSSVGVASAGERSVFRRRTQLRKSGWSVSHQAAVSYIADVFSIIPQCRESRVIELSSNAALSPSLLPRDK